jgi:hypothetical protein
LYHGRDMGDRDGTEELAGTPEIGTRPRRRIRPALARAPGGLPPGGGRMRTSPQSGARPGPPPSLHSGVTWAPSDLGSPGVTPGSPQRSHAPRDHNCLWPPTLAPNRRATHPLRLEGPSQPPTPYSGCAAAAGTNITVGRCRRRGGKEQGGLLAAVDTEDRDGADVT